MAMSVLCVWWTTTLSMMTWVNDDLGKERRSQTDQLDEKRSGEHVAPDAFVPQELRPEPSEAEGGAAGTTPLGGSPFRRFMAEKQSLSLEAGKVVKLAGRRRLAAGLEVKQLLAVRLHEDCRPRSLAPQKRDAGEARLRQRRFADAETKGLQGFEELAAAMRRRITLQDQGGIEWQAVDLAKAAYQPDEVVPRQFPLQQPLPPALLMELLFIRIC
jgi:hypothetical protein